MILETTNATQAAAAGAGYLSKTWDQRLLTSYQRKHILKTSDDRRRPEQGDDLQSVLMGAYHG